MKMGIALYLRINKSARVIAPIKLTIEILETALIISQ